MRTMSTLGRLRRVIEQVPRGRVITYGGVATAAGFPGATRLTVRALQGGDELPWHRVVGAGGRIALSGAEGREQRLRLQLEGVTFRGGRVRMDLHAWHPRRLQRASRSERRSPPLRPARGPPRARTNSDRFRDAVTGFGPRPKPIRRNHRPEADGFRDDE